MRILLFGTTGQVGWELRRALQPLGEVIAVSRAEGNFDAPESLRAAFACAPDVVVNAVAHTAVDLAETQVDEAMRINAEAVKVLAEECARRKALLVHYSTDYVFDGASTTPYRETDPTAPQSSYGRSKLAGEQAIAASGCDALTLRTSWVFASRGKNFVRTMLRFAAEREALRIVADQHGAPTSARLIADTTAQVIAVAQRERQEGRFASGVFHLVAGGKTTWHGLATYVIERARGSRIGETVKTRTIDGIATHEYPVPAKRPANSVLDTSALRTRFGVALPDWTVGVDLVLEELLAE